MRMLEIKVFDIGKTLIKRVAVDEELFNRYVKEKKDLSTRWYRRIFAHLFYPATEGGEVKVAFTDKGGTARSQYIKKNCDVIYILWNTKECNNRPWIAIGNGTTSPSLDDYALESEIAEAVASFDLNEENGILTLSAGFTPDVDITISEVGLFLECAVGGYTTCGKVLLDRTVLDTPINVSAGQTATVAYRIAL